jgi:hypothetical protein
VSGSGCPGSKGERRAVADGGEGGAEVVVVYGGDLGFVGDQPRDAHYLGVVAGVVAEAAGGEDYAGERRSLRVDAGFECGGFLARESLAVLAPESGSGPARTAPEPCARGGRRCSYGTARRWKPGVRSPAREWSRMGLDKRFVLGVASLPDVVSGGCGWPKTRSGLGIRAEQRKRRKAMLALLPRVGTGRQEP